MKKGQAKVWVLVVILVFFVSAAWYVSMRAFIPIDDKITSTYSSDLQNSTHMGSRPFQVYERAYRIVKFWPVALISGIILIGVFFSLRRDPNEFFFR